MGGDDRGDSTSSSSSMHLSKRVGSRKPLEQSFSSDNPSDPPPTTPPNSKKKGLQQRRQRDTGKGKQPVQQAPTTSPDDPQRHSHGLSWSSTTRDSVVDNLLTSLDNISRPPDSEQQQQRGKQELEFDRNKYMFPFAPSLPTKTRQARGHTFSSSLSSEPVTESSASHASTPKGRRSNSSSNFGVQHSLSARVRSSDKNGRTSRASEETQKAVSSEEVQKTLLGGDKQKSIPAQLNGTFNKQSSQLGGENYGYSSLTNTSRAGRHRRSMSMDQIYADAAENYIPGRSMLNRGRPVPSVHSTFDNDAHAAPEPTVAAGPRKLQYPSATGPVYVNQASKVASLRKTNTQTDLRSVSMPITTPIPPVPQDVRKQASDFVRASSMQGSPTIPGQERSVPSPPAQGGNPKYAAPAQRERPGFFKRVFGGGSNRSSMADQNDSSENVGNVAATTGQTHGPPTQSRSPKTQEAPKEQPTGTTHPPVSLNKKTSFFRRRKKSMSDMETPPPPLPPAAKNLKVSEARASVSSLRKVMDPYLDDKKVQPRPVQKQEDPLARPGTQDSTENSDLDIFHSGYTPPEGASLGIRNALSPSPSGNNNSKQGIDTLKDDSPKHKMKVKKRKNEMLARMNTSFSRDADGISDERSLQRSASRASSGDRIIADAELSRSIQSRADKSVSDDGFVRSNAYQERPETARSDRLFLQPTASEEILGYNFKDLTPVQEDWSQSNSTKSPNVNAGSQPSSARSPSVNKFSSAVQSPVSPADTFHSLTSPPVVQVDGNEPRKSMQPMEAPPVSLPINSVEDEGAEYRERARKIFDGDEEDVMKSEAASWLGERNTLSTKTLEAYMRLFSFSGFNILTALRLLSSKLVLKGETQQFDRIITAMSSRWCECNPNHGFKAQDVVHTICYSLILLNTDLHLADIGEKMSRNAYVKNTLPTIRRVVKDAAPNAFDETIKPSPNNSRPTLPWSDSSNSIPRDVTASERTSLEQDQRPGLAKRLSIRPPFERQNSDNAGAPDFAASPGFAISLVHQPWPGSQRGWELELENILKSFYASIRSDPLPLHGAPAAQEVTPVERNLSVQNFNTLKRTGSIVSKTGSEAASYRSKPGFRGAIFQNKYNRSRPKLYQNSTQASSRTSFDDGNSVWSPVQSSNWSKYSFSKTLTSASMQSLGTHLTPSTGDFKHSIGFANALSQAIIREEIAFNKTDDDSVSMSVPGGVLEDEALALEGPPWAKEGLVQHKHHLEASGKKAKERNWSDCFAVIGKGKLTLFAFNTSGGSRSMSMGRKPFTKPQANGRAASASTGQGVGGGDWMENAEQLDVFVLRQTIASVLPPPGYSKTRPHVWALSLPSGAVHLFQVGTPDIAQEFMTTANYWSARLSKEPLSGGVSNIEYGWSDQVINPALVEQQPSSSRSTTTSPTPRSPPMSMQNRPNHMHSSSNSGLPRPSFQSSIRTSMDNGFGGGGRSRLPGDKAQLTDWHPPSQSMMASQLMEVDQLRALTAYVANVETELARHNELKQAIDLAYSPRAANHVRAMANWQRKSDHLLREIVKFQTYVDSLSAAQKSKDALYARKAENKPGVAA